MRSFRVGEVRGGGNESEVIHFKDGRSECVGHSKCRRAICDSRLLRLGKRLAFYQYAQWTNILEYRNHDSAVVSTKLY